MVKVYLDTNYFIDSVHRMPDKAILDTLKEHKIYISPLSIHVYFYIFKLKIPNYNLKIQRDKFYIVEFTENILDKALSGPTSDLEDNIQLHSAAEIPCDFFLTNDENILKMKFFGKTRISDNLIINI